MKLPRISAGSVATAGLAKRHGFAELARRLGVSEATVRGWAKARRSPGPAMRATLNAAFAVELGAWDEEPSARSRATGTTHADATRHAAARSKGSPGSGTSRRPGRAWGTSAAGLAVNAPSAPTGNGEFADDTRDPKVLVLEVLDGLRAQLRATSTDGTVTPRERASLANACTSALRLYSRLSGELEITEVSILRSAAWARLRRIVLGALDAHPEAAKAVALAVESYAGGAP